MKDATILKIGVIGAVIAALCCFTPLLVIGLAVVGLSAWLGYADYVLLPALALFVGLAAYGFWHRRRTATCCATDTEKS